MQMGGNMRLSALSFSLFDCLPVPLHCPPLLISLCYALHLFSSFPSFDVSSICDELVWLFKAHCKSAVEYSWGILICLRGMGMIVHCQSLIYQKNK